MRKPASKAPVAAKRAARSSRSKTAAPADEPRIAAPAPAPAAPLRTSKNLLTAGIKALSNVHEEAVARQSRVFESLLGLGPRRDAAEASAEPGAATSLDPFGFKKFEDVFDQRVAKSMQHLGVPTVEAFAELVAEVERLREAIAQLEAQSRKR